MDVVAAIFIQKNKALVARRPLEKSHGGLWEFPGGKVKAGENHEQALAREIWEELKVRIEEKELSLLGSVSTKDIDLYFYFLKLPAPFFPQEHPATTWLSFSELCQKDLCPSDQKALTLFEKDLRPRLRG